MHTSLCYLSIAEQGYVITADSLHSLMVWKVPVLVSLKAVTCNSCVVVTHAEGYGSQCGVSPSLSLLCTPPLHLVFCSQTCAAASPPPHALGHPAVVNTMQHQQDDEQQQQP